MNVIEELSKCKNVFINAKQFMMTKVYNKLQDMTIWTNILQELEYPDTDILICYHFNDVNIFFSKNGKILCRWTIQPFSRLIWTDGPNSSMVMSIRLDKKETDNFKDLELVVTETVRVDRNILVNLYNCFKRNGCGLDKTLTDADITHLTSNDTLSKTLEQYISNYIEMEERINEINILEQNNALK